MVLAGLPRHGRAFLPTECEKVWIFNCAKAAGSAGYPCTSAARLTAMQDITNSLQLPKAPVASKTFQRRSKAALAPCPEHDDSDGFVEEHGMPEHLNAPAESTNDDTHRPYSWLGLSKCRRTSCLPAPFLSDNAPGQKRGQRRRDASQKQRAEELQALMHQMSLHYQEVDAYELVEESPQAKAPATRARASAQRRATGTHDDQLHVGRLTSSRPAPVTAAVQPDSGLSRHVNQTPVHSQAIAPLHPQQAPVPPMQSTSPGSMHTSLQASWLASSTPLSRGSSLARPSAHIAADGNPADSLGHTSVSTGPSTSLAAAALAPASPWPCQVAAAHTAQAWVPEDNTGAASVEGKAAPFGSSLTTPAAQASMPPFSALRNISPSPSAQPLTVPSSKAPALHQPSSLSQWGAAVPARLSVPDGLEPVCLSEASPNAASPNSDSVDNSPAAEPLSPLQQLLEVCSQSVEVEAVPSMEELLSSMGDLRRMVKVGEGSYGEAFKQGSTVLKIIPIEGQRLVNGYPQKKAADITGEAAVALALTQLRLGNDQHAAPCFVHTSKVAVCHGPYPRLLAKAWHKWDEQHGSENDAVDGPGWGAGCAAARSQLYLVLAMEDAGRDLEKHALSRGMQEARAILAQVAFALAVGEAALGFEHRDLHWGNVMVRPAISSTLAFKLQGQQFNVQTCGIQVSLIDFTASRLVTEEGRHAWFDFSQDPEVFQGPEGQVQFDTYREMQSMVGNNWAKACPRTNVLWLSYMAEIMAAEKIKGQGAVAHKRQLREFRQRCSRYSSCQEMVLQDEMFQGTWTKA